jgi:hypothetical protein
MALKVGDKLKMSRAGLEAEILPVARPSLRTKAKDGSPVPAPSSSGRPLPVSEGKGRGRPLQADGKRTHKLAAHFSDGEMELLEKALWLLSEERGFTPNTTTFMRETFLAWANNYVKEAQRKSADQSESVAEAEAESADKAESIAATGPGAAPGP